MARSIRKNAKSRHTEKYWWNILMSSGKQAAKAVEVSENDIFRAVNELKNALNSKERANEIFYCYILKTAYNKKIFSFEEVLNYVNRYYKHIPISEAILKTYKDLANN